MEAGLVHSLGHDEAQAADGLNADGDPPERGLPSEAVGFGCRQHRGHDYRTGMNRAAFKGVIEVFAMRGRAIDEGRTRRAHALGVTDDGGGTLLRPCGERRGDILAAARRNAQANDVDEHALADFADGRFHPAGIEASDALGETQGNGVLLIAHVTPVVFRIPVLANDRAARTPFQCSTGRCHDQGLPLARGQGRSEAIRGLDRKAMPAREVRFGVPPRQASGRTSPRSGPRLVVAQTDPAEAWDAVDGDDDGGGQNQHRQPQHGDCTQIAALL
jgi:hypothetical protein